MIRLNHLSFSYSRTPVFHDVSREFPDACLLSAPNGAGKTTLLRLLARQLTPDSGSIAFDNPANSIAFCDSGSLLFDDITLSTHLEWLSAVSPHRDWTQIPDLCGLRPLLLKTPAELSAGLRHFAALSLTLLLRADFFLFDEPLRHLDDAHKNAFLQNILHFTNGNVIVTTTDNPPDNWKNVFPIVHL